jgi:uncharacterized GH25 family protein
MKKYIFLVSFLILILSGNLMAADYWAWVEESDVDKPATVIYGYGTDFPKGDPIKDSVFITRYLPPKIMGSSGEIEVEGHPLQAWIYTTKTPLTSGRYIITTENKPTFWSKTATDQVNKPKNEVPNATSCNQFVFLGKYVLTIGTDESEDYSKPLGQKLEIVPQSDPAKIKEGEPFKVQVLYDGKPLAKTELNAFISGLTKDNSAYSFSARANDEGILDIIPLKKGVWLAKVVKNDDYSDTAICDKVQYYSTLTFVVGEAAGENEKESIATNASAASNVTEPSKKLGVSSSPPISLGP